VHNGRNCIWLALRSLANTLGMNEVMFKLGFASLESLNIHCYFHCQCFFCFTCSFTSLVPQYAHLHGMDIMFPFSYLFSMLLLSSRALVHLHDSSSRNRPFQLSMILSPGTSAICMDPYHMIIVGFTTTSSYTTCHLLPAIKCYCPHSCTNTFPCNPMNQPLCYSMLDHIVT